MCAGKTMKPFHKPVKVAIGACTYRRPDDLVALLESLIRLEPVPGVDLSVVIVDNDAEPSAQATVAAAVTGCLGLCTTRMKQILASLLPATGSCVRRVPRGF